MYASTILSVEVGDYCTDTFLSFIGVRQGDNLSLHFSISSLMIFLLILTLSVTQSFQLQDKLAAYYMPMI